MIRREEGVRGDERFYTVAVRASASGVLAGLGMLWSGDGDLGKDWVKRRIPVLALMPVG